MILDLQYECELQGKFHLRNINVMLVLQVNCPGCFVYGLPIIHSLSKSFEDVSFSILSTCFEDYQYNTLEHTANLLSDGRMVGATRKFFSEHGLTRYPLKIELPVLFDKVYMGAEFASDARLSLLAEKHPRANEIRLVGKQKEFHQVLYTHFMQFEKIGYTFACHFLQGTPTFLVFNGNNEILTSILGYTDASSLSGVIKRISNRVAL